MLRAEFHKQQAQEMPDLGAGADGRFTPTTREPLLDRYRRRNTVHRIHFRSPGWLHDRACISVERLQIAALTFVEKDVKSECGFAGARHAGDDAEFTAWDVDAQVF